MSLTLNVSGLDKLTSMLEQAPEVAIKHANASIVAIVNLVEVNVKKEAPIDTKKLHNRWTKAFKPLEGTLTSQMPYAGAVQFGTPPHKVSIEEITPWAERKGIPPFLVARSIAKKGTKANPFFTRGLDNSVERANIIIKGTINNIVNELTNK